MFDRQPKTMYIRRGVGTFLGTVLEVSSFSRERKGLRCREGSVR